MVGSIMHLMNMSLSKLSDGHGQGSLACCSLWGHKYSDMTEQLSSTEAIFCWFAAFYSRGCGVGFP